jgi:hypothetical protein
MIIERPSFNAIPPYTRGASYQVDAGWDYFQDWLEENKPNLNPDFQRPHVWDEQKQVRYVEHVLRNGASGADIYFNYPGWRTSYEGEFVIVDGKQRVEAVRRFMHDEISAFGFVLSEYRKERKIMPMQCRFRVHINDLKTRKEVLQWYLDLNDGGIAHTTAELDKVRRLLGKE